MGYHEARTLEIRDAHATRVKEFIRTYRPGRPTVVMLPGGLGSQLDRSDTRYRDDIPIPFFKYDPVWIDLGLLFNDDALKLEIRKDNRDKGSHIIIPDGPLRFLIKPYDRTEQYFRDERRYNYVVFGFDWRRDIGEAAGFLEDFLRHIRDAVRQRHDGEDPLANTTLLCHSHGGLVAKVFLHRPGAIRRSIGRVITVATPFYGNSTHIQRYYHGEAALNTLHGRGTVARITATFPGPYIFLYLDTETWRDQGAKLGLDEYPMRDAATGAPADPYDPANFGRYPNWVRREFIRKAARLLHTIALPLPPSAQSRMFHIRSGNNNGTFTRLTWAPVTGADFDPDEDELPIGGDAGPGDGTVPTWSARLAQTPDERVYDLSLARDHQDILEHRETLEVVNHIIENDSLPDAVRVADEIYGGAKPKASEAELQLFLSEIAAGTATRNDPRATDEAMLNKLVEEMNLC